MSRIKFLKPKADVESERSKGRLRYELGQGDPDVLRQHSIMGIPHINPAAEPQFRITEAGDLRITETHANKRILETAT